MEEEFQYPDWRPVVTAAITGFGKDGQIERVMAGEYLVHKRFYEIAGVAGNVRERLALQDATNTLRALQYPVRSENLG